MSSSRKGAIAEVEIAAALIGLDLVVLRPMCEGGRYDLVVDLGARFLRLQCKWASRRGSVLTARCVTSRHTPAGYLRSTYSAHEVDAIAAYAPESRRCYLIPIVEAEGRTTLSLRLSPTRNNQAEHVRWAKDYEMSSSLRRNWGIGVDEPSVVEERPLRAIGLGTLGL